VTSGLFTFNFAAGTQASDQDLIKNAVTTQAAFFLSALGRTITQPTIINSVASDPGCAAAGASAFTGIAKLTICANNFGWTAHDALNRQKIVMHELFHALQFEVHWLGHPNPDASSAHWMDEGAAEYMGWRGAANAGLVSFDTARQCMIAQANAQVPAAAKLSSLETAQGFGVPGAYQFSMLALDQLATNAGIGALMTYGAAIGAGTSWPTAFESAFGTSTTAFYDQFPSYRSGLGAGSDSCGT
jgi:hypothetical protein